MDTFIFFASVLLVISGAVVFGLGGVGRRRTAALVALTAALISNVADAQQIDFAIALKRAPASATVRAIGPEPDWSSALQRRTASQPIDELPDSWDAMAVRQQPITKTVSATKAQADRTEKCLFFTAPWCGICATQKTFLEPKVKAAGLTMSEAPDADIRMINVERNRGLQAKYRVNDLPCLVYLDKSGNEVDRVTGFDRERLRTPTAEKLK